MCSFFHTERLIFFRATPTTVAPEPIGGGPLNISALTDADQIPQEFCRSDEMKGEWERRYRDGHTAVVAFLGDIPVHLAWFARKHLYISEIDMQWQITDDTLCIYDCTTRDGYRGKGYYPKVLRWMREQINAVDVKNCNVWIYSDHGNKSSMSGIQKAGFKQIGCANAIFGFGLVLKRSQSFTL